MDDLKACPVCRKVPKLGYCCGEYFVSGEDADCPCCGTAFTEMHSSAELEVAAWNSRAEGNWGKPIRKEEAIKILARHLMQCGALMPMEWVQKNGAGSEFMQAFELAMAALKNEPVLCEEWISVKDRLPTIYDADADNCVLAIHKASNKRYYHWRSVADNPFDFTYWTRTPQPPKGETIYCKDCEHLMFSDCYGECAKGYKGIVQPNDTCEHARRKPPKGE